MCGWPVSVYGPAEGILTYAEDYKAQGSVCQTVGFFLGKFWRCQHQHICAGILYPSVATTVNIWSSLRNMILKWKKYHILCVLYEIPEHAQWWLPYSADLTVWLISRHLLTAIWIRLAQFKSGSVSFHSWVMPCFKQQSKAWSSTWVGNVRNNIFILEIYASKFPF